MTSVAVVAHRGKTLGGGLQELRSRLESDIGAVTMWCEVDKSRMAPEAAQRCVDGGADLLIVWGGDGTVQRVLGAVAGAEVTLGIIPAGTANLLATNLGIPKDIGGALDVALHGARRDLDVGVVNGERFAVMAGAGLDAVMIKDADGKFKERLGRLAYVVSGVRASGRRNTKMIVDVDGSRWFKGRAGCVLFGSMGTLTGGLVAFPDADPCDGLLEIGVVTADSRIQWARVVGRMATKHPDRTPLTRATRGRKAIVRFAKRTAYELDGGDRPPTKKLKVRVEPGAVRIAVPVREGSK
jgi:diacylglycerol kinase (ATP)